MTEKIEPYQATLPVEAIGWGRLVTKHELELSKGNKEDVSKVLEKMIKTECIQNNTCQRCNNQNETRMAVLPRQPAFGIMETRKYCLNCLQMGRMTEGDSLYHLPGPVSIPLRHNLSVMTWKGQLSPEQTRAAEELLSSLSDSHRPHMIHAVTGAGKTEMIFPAIEAVLKQGGRVGVVSPRIDVCLELVPRLQQAFEEIPIQLLYGGATEPYGYTPLVVSTVHQLLRFKEAFDLLIVDEVDAFPYAGDETLHFAVERSVKKEGKLVYLTATPDEELRQQVTQAAVTLTTLPARFHGYSLPEPQFKWIGDWRTAINKQKRFSHIWLLIQSFIQREGVKLIFMPNIRLAEKLFQWLCKRDTQASEWLACVHAKDPDRQIKVDRLRQGKLTTLITTTILERGVTFTNCHVCIIGAEDRLYSQAALVQMSGRVGRKKEYPTGDLIYAHGGVSRSMRQARKQIQSMNQQANERGLLIQ